MGFIPKATWFLGNAKCNVSCFHQVPLMTPSETSLGTEMPVVLFLLWANGFLLFAQMPSVLAFLFCAVLPFEFKD